MRGLIVLALLMVQGPRDLKMEEAKPPLVVPKGTSFPVSLLNRLSTKNLEAGANIYAHTLLPLTASNTVVVPAGSSVKGKVIEVERPGRVKGKPALKIVFQTLILPNGVTMPLYASLGQSDTGVRKGEATIEGDSQKGKDAEDVAIGGARGGVIGAIFGGAKGAGLGAGAGAAAGLAGVLISRNDDLTLERGTTIDIILDEKLEF